MHGWRWRLLQTSCYLKCLILLSWPPISAIFFLNPGHLIIRTNLKSLLILKSSHKLLRTTPSFESLPRGIQHFIQTGLQDNCGHKGPGHTRIVGGTNAKPGDWPWQVNIDYEFNSANPGAHCGGTLINDEWVLSAAHCFKDDPAKEKYWVKLGKWSTISIRTDSIWYSIDKHWIIFNRFCYISPCILTRITSLTSQGVAPYVLVMLT